MSVSEPEPDLESESMLHVIDHNAWNVTSWSLGDAASALLETSFMNVWRFISTQCPCPSARVDVANQTAKVGGSFAPNVRVAVQFPSIL